MLTHHMHGAIRYDVSVMAKHEAIVAAGPIDHLYLDNTYGPAQMRFPSRLVAAQAVVDIIRSFPTKRVVIGIDSLGKEELLHFVSTSLHMPVRTATLVGGCGWCSLCVCSSVCVCVRFCVLFCVWRLLSVLTDACLRSWYHSSAGGRSSC